jgi:hypothetical protein
MKIGFATTQLAYQRNAKHPYDRKNGIKEK